MFHRIVKSKRASPFSLFTQYELILQSSLAYDEVEWLLTHCLRVRIFICCFQKSRRHNGTDFLENATGRTWPLRSVVFGCCSKPSRWAFLACSQRLLRNDGVVEATRGVYKSNQSTNLLGSTWPFVGQSQWWRGRWVQREISKTFCLNRIRRRLNKSSDLTHLAVTPGVPLRRMLRC